HALRSHPSLIVRPRGRTHYSSPPSPPHETHGSRGAPGSRGRVGRGGKTHPLYDPGVLRWLTAGESHGPQLTVLIEGVPAGLELTAEDLRRDLRRRQGGHGRGGRQQIEVDEARIVGGVRGGRTLGSPIALVLVNRDHANLTEQMTPAP